eukprot:g6535.t1
MVTGDLPFSLSSLGKEQFVVLPLEKTWQIVKASKLETSIVAPQGTRTIRALTTFSMYTFTAVGTDILVWDKTEQVTVLRGHKSNVDMLLMLGSHLLSISRSDRCLKVWDFKAGVQMGQDLYFPASFVPTAWMHPHTYLNKILIGSEDGRIHLWNIRTRKRVYEFTFELRSKITCIEQAPALDVVAFGTESGKIAVYNIRVDRTIMVFSHAEGSVTSLSFRTDSQADVLPLLASGCSSGRIAFWSLNEKKLHSQLDAAHEADVTNVAFLPGRPLLLSSGKDNALRQWALDKIDGSARLLRAREGHRKPPLCIRYYGGVTTATTVDGSDGRCCQILSASDDRSFRSFHTARAQQSCEISQGKLVAKARQLQVSVESLKLPPILSIASAETRSRQWANIVTCHKDHPSAHIWSFDKKAIGKHVLTPPSTAGAPRCASISVCGNTALLGTTNGVVMMYNLQSGRFRSQIGGKEGYKGTYKGLNQGWSLGHHKGKSSKFVSTKFQGGNTDKYSTETNGRKQEQVEEYPQHEGTITGVDMDGLGLTIVTCGLDGTVRFWDYVTRRQLSSITLPGNVPASRLTVFRDSGLAAVCCDDLVIRIFDIASHRLVRRFSGHTSKITDVVFSNDGRWVISSSANGDMRVWDLPTSRCVDWIRFSSPVRSLDFSPTGEYIATSHVGRRGIYLWANRYHFDDILLDSCTAKPIEMELPLPGLLDDTALSGENDDEKDEDDETEKENIPENEMERENENENKVVPLHSGFVTLSTIPRHRWATLPKLDIIQQRNKPKEAPKAPEKAPFFLPNTIASSDAAFHTTANGKMEENRDENNRVKSKVLKRSFDGETLGGRSKTKLMQLLSGKVKSENVLNYLESLTPSAVHVALGFLSFGPADVESVPIIGSFLDCAIELVKTRENFQTVQAYLNVFVKMHADTIQAHSNLQAKISKLRDCQRESWLTLQGKMRSNLCLLKFFSGLST